jgi:hypothetical protein
MRRIALGMVLAGLFAALTAGPAGACGGLVGENGTIQLTRTTTLAAHHGGVEHYVTSFAFTGTGEQVGSIVPLPGVPTKVERGGDWTLQRLRREIPQPPRTAVGFDLAGSAATRAEVLQEVQVDALDITILRGGSDEVGRWATDHGFLLTPDAPEVLAFYAARSPVFMAARFDAARAGALGQQAGDGTPIMLTIPTAEPWVPLRILSLGLGKAQPVAADVFLLTDTTPTVRTGGGGTTVRRSERAPATLLDDLRSDRHMGWVPDDMWLTYLSVDAPARELNYDLAVSTRQGVAPSATAVGIGALGGPEDGGRGVPYELALPLVALVGGLVVLLVVTRRGWRTRTEP